MDQDRLPSSQFPKIWMHLASLRGVVGFYAVYSVINILISYGAGTTLALDDVKLNVLVQNLQAGYLPDNPPLYEWLLLSVQQLTGPVLLSFLLVKYLLLILSGGLVFLILEKWTKSETWSSFGAVGLLSLYQIGSNYHQTFTHSLVLITTILFFLLTLQRLLEQPTLKNYHLTAIAIGLGLLAKYSFPASLVIILAAALVDKKNRNVLLSPKMTLALLFGAALFSPHGIWVYHHQGQFSDQLTRHFGEQASYFLRLAQGIPSLLWAVLSFFLPFIIFTSVTLRKSLFPIRLKSLFNANAPWFVWVLPFGVGLMAVFVIVLGLSSLQERYGIGFLLPGYLVLIVMLQKASPPKAPLQRCIFVMSVFIILWPTARFIQNIVPGPPFCKNCRQWIPYDGLQKPLAVMGVTKADSDKVITLVGFEDHTAGNLRRLYPKARIVSTHLPFYKPRPILNEPQDQRCIFIWSPDLGPTPPAEFLESLAGQTQSQVSVPWRHPFKKTGWRETKWQITEVSPDNYAYNVICAQS